MTTLASASWIPGGEGVRREPAEDDRAAPIRAQGQHRDCRLRDHRHLDGDQVALLYTQLQQVVGGLGDFVLEFSVGEGTAVAGLAPEADRPGAVGTGLKAADLLDIDDDTVTALQRSEPADC